MMEARLITPKETHSLRHRVLWPHIDNEEDCVIDIDHRPDAIHLGTFDGEKLVSILSLFEMTTPKLEHARQYRLRAMATDPEYTGRGAGRVIVMEAKRLLAAKGYDVLWCDARKVALGFYERLGFETIDEWYEVRNIGLHKLMYFELRPRSLS
jgi:GNAT superfamily N-acetyltransferase